MGAWLVILWVLCKQASLPVWKVSICCETWNCCKRSSVTPQPSFRWFSCLTEVYSATHKRVDFFVNLHAKFFPSNIEPWLVRPVFMYLLSYRDRCFWRIDDIDNHPWQLRMHVRLHAGYAAHWLMKFMTYSIFHSLHAKIIISWSVAQRYHGVFLVFEFDQFFSEPTIRFFSGPRGRNQPPKRSRSVALLLYLLMWPTSQLIQPSGCHLCNMPKHKRLSSICASLTGYHRDPSRDTQWIVGGCWLLY